jgi:K+-transporting ATPase A subunit
MAMLTVADLRAGDSDVHRHYVVSRDFGTSSVFNPDRTVLSEMLYAYSVGGGQSMARRFGGISVTRGGYKHDAGLAMLFGRFFIDHPAARRSPAA